MPPNKKMAQRFYDTAVALLYRKQPVAELFVAAAGTLLVIDAARLANPVFRVGEAVAGLAMIVASATRCIVTLRAPSDNRNRDPH